MGCNSRMLPSFPFIANVRLIVSIGNPMSSRFPIIFYTNLKSVPACGYGPSDGR